MISSPAIWFGLAALMAGAFCVVTLGIILRRQRAAEARPARQQPAPAAAPDGATGQCGGGKAGQDAGTRVAA